MTDILPLQKPDGTQFYPQTHVQAVIGLAAAILSGLKVTSVNEKTGDVVLTASDVGAATQDDINTAIQAINAGSLNLYTKQEIDDKLAAKQDHILTSPIGNKFLITVADDGTIGTQPYSG